MNTFFCFDFCLTGVLVLIFILQSFGIDFLRSINGSIIFSLGPGYNGNLSGSSYN